MVRCGITRSRSIHIFKAFEIYFPITLRDDWYQDVVPLERYNSSWFLRFLLILVNSVGSWFGELPCTPTLQLRSFCCDSSGIDIGHYFAFPWLCFGFMYQCLAWCSDFIFLLDHQPIFGDHHSYLNPSPSSHLLWLMCASWPWGRIEILGWGPEEQGRDPFPSPG